MSRRDNADARCGRCRMHESLCLCALIPRLETRTRLVLVIHRYEDRKPTNTGRLATRCLVNSEVIVRGHATGPTSPLAFDPGSQSVVLFPMQGATPLAEYARSERPLRLIVPDGTWRQASKVRNRVPGLIDLPCVSLAPREPSTYRLRTETQEGGLATIEAIARAMGVLEGSHVQRALEHIFRVMVDRTLWSRGRILAADVSGGIPEAARLHDPRGGLPRVPPP